MVRVSYEEGGSESAVAATATSADVNDIAGGRSHGYDSDSDQEEDHGDDVRETRITRRTVSSTFTGTGTEKKQEKSGGAQSSVYGARETWAFAGAAAGAASASSPAGTPAKFEEAAAARETARGELSSAGEKLSRVKVRTVEVDAMQQQLLVLQTSLYPATPSPS